jgi:hypothetical protein
MSTARHALALSLFVCAAVLVSAAQAQNLKTVQFPGKGAQFTVAGIFDVSRTIYPGNQIGYFTSRSGNLVFWIYSYDFAGRTGEKTFDVLFTEMDSGGKTKETKVSVYFDPSTPFPLNGMDLASRLSGCPSGDVPKLKMISLNGNELEAQVLLPACLQK